MSAVTWEMSERADRRRRRARARDVLAGIEEFRAEMDRIEAMNRAYGWTRSSRQRDYAFRIKREPWARKALRWFGINLIRHG